MPSIRSSQLQLALDAAGARRGGGFVVTRALRSHRSCNRALESLRYVLRYFPELGGTSIRVGLTRAASGMAVPGGFEVWLNPARVSYHTIAHELVHLLQRTGGDVPRGERSCDLFSLARHWTLNDVLPGYVEVPARMAGADGRLDAVAARAVYDTAVEALDRRHRGMRRYIAWFEDRLGEIAASWPRSTGADSALPRASR